MLVLKHFCRGCSSLVELSIGGNCLHFFMYMRALSHSFLNVFLVGTNIKEFLEVTLFIA